MFTCGGLGLMGKDLMSLLVMLLGFIRGEREDYRGAREFGEFMLRADALAEREL